MKKRKTNVEFVTDLMNFSSSGALIQPFVISALESYSNEVIKDFKANRIPENPNAIVSAAQWNKIAEEVKIKLKEQYSQNAKTTSDIPR
jgi:Trm5-related predicted tRNA methylase